MESQEKSLNMRKQDIVWGGMFQEDAVDPDRTVDVLVSRCLWDALWKGNHRWRWRTQRKDLFRVMRNEGRPLKTRAEHKENTSKDRIPE